jgi:hypothetical protein
MDRWKRSVRQNATAALDPSEDVEIPTVRTAPRNAEVAVYDAVSMARRMMARRIESVVWLNPGIHGGQRTVAWNGYEGAILTYDHLPQEEYEGQSDDDVNECTTPQPAL